MNLALFSTNKPYLSAECADATEHMERMTNKENPVYCNLVLQPNSVSLTKAAGQYYINIHHDELSPDEKEKIYNIIKSCDIVTLPGGNTFEISYYLQKNNFYPILKNFASMPNKVIAGSSAGSIMCTPTIMSAKWADDMIPYIDILPSTDGLNLVNFFIKPHAQKYLPSYNEKFQKFVDDHNRSMFCIDDGGCIIVDNDKIHIYGFVTDINPTT